MTEQQAIDLVHDLRRIGRECEWAEFKCNNQNPDEIAEYISAMSNSAAILGVDVAYLVWGIQDNSMVVVGTEFKPFNAKKGSEPLFNWLIRSIIPQIDIQFVETKIECQSVVLLMIPKAPNQPVRFGSEAFVRVDSQKRKLKDYPEHARKLWASFDKSTFEAGIALQDIDGPRVLQLIDFSTCFDKLGIAVIHQDFSIRGTGPLIEIFDRRIEITNLGKPLLDPIRFIDGPPRSRNEALAAMARRLSLCEELGTGIDKVIRAVELFQLPPPEFESPVDSTRATLWAHKPLEDMTRDERVRACLQHASLCIVTGEQMTNSTVRKRFGLANTQSAKATRIINETLDTGQIKPVNPEASRKFMRYVPSWC